MVTDPEDTWSLGAPPRTFRANGKEISGTVDYGGFSFGGATFDFGALVGRIGTGDFFFIGLGGVFNATTSGALSLFTWDTQYGDNSGSIMVDVTAPVPVPAAGLLLLSALAMGGVVSRSRRKAA